jgi:hypothetical protein
VIVFLQVGLGYTMRYWLQHAGEGVSLACTFWLADNLAMLGRREADRCFLRNFFAFCTEECSGSRGIGIDIGKLLVPDGKSGAHNAMAEGADVPAPGMRNLSEQSVDVQAV